MATAALAATSPSTPRCSFRFVILLTSLHFFTGYGFLSLVSMEGSSMKLFTRGKAPFVVRRPLYAQDSLIRRESPSPPRRPLQPILKLSVAGALSSEHGRRGGA